MYQKALVPKFGTSFSTVKKLYESTTHTQIRFFLYQKKLLKHCTDLKDFWYTNTRQNSDLVWRNQLIHIVIFIFFSKFEPISINWIQLTKSKFNNILYTNDLWLQEYTIFYTLYTPATNTKINRFVFRAFKLNLEHFIFKFYVFFIIWISYQDPGDANKCLVAEIFFIDFMLN